MGVYTSLVSLLGMENDVKTTIYLPDRLGERVQARADLNVSAVCQRALSAELDFLNKLDKADEGMERIELHDESRDGLTVSFIGRELVSSGQLAGYGNDFTVYLTSRHRIAIYDEKRQVLHDYDNLDEAEYGGQPPDLLAAAAQELGDFSRVVELDI